MHCWFRQIGHNSVLPHYTTKQNPMNERRLDLPKLASPLLNPRPPCFCLKALQTVPLDSEKLLTGALSLSLSLSPLACVCCFRFVFDFVVFFSREEIQTASDSSPASTRPKRWPKGKMPKVVACTNSCKALPPKQNVRHPSHRGSWCCTTGLELVLHRQNKHQQNTLVFGEEHRLAANITILDFSVKRRCRQRLVLIYKLLGTNPNSNQQAQVSQAPEKTDPPQGETSTSHLVNRL